MKKFAYAALLTLAAGMIFVPARAADDDDEKKFTVHGEVRQRWEYQDNVGDLTDKIDDGDQDDEFSFAPYRARVGVMGQFSNNVSGYISIQDYGFWGNEFPLRGEAMPLDQTDGNIDDSEIDLYQAYIAINEIGGSKLSLKAGRMELSMGTELLIGDNDYYNGQSFDGIVGGWDFEKWDLHFGWLTIEDNNVDNCIDDPFLDGSSSDCDDDNIDLYGGGANFEIGDTGQHVEPYIIHYRDGDSGDFGISTSTIGARWSRGYDDEDQNLLDWSLEALIQTGEIDPNGINKDHSASLIEGTLGFNFSHGDDAHSRVHVGFLSSSGDDNDTDNDNEAFFPLFGDNHSNNRLGNIDFGGNNALSGLLTWTEDIDEAGEDTGITDISAGYTFTMGNHMFMAAIHLLTATEDALAGNGATLANEDDIGQMIDLGYGYRYSQNLSFNVELSNFMPGDAFEGLATTDFEDDALRIAGQARLRW